MVFIISEIISGYYFLRCKEEGGVVRREGGEGV